MHACHCTSLTQVPMASDVSTFQDTSATQLRPDRDPNVEYGPDPTLGNQNALTGL